MYFGSPYFGPVSNRDYFGAFYFGGIPAPARAYKAGGGVGWVAEYPTGRDLWKLKRDDRDLLEIIAAITRVLK